MKTTYILLLLAGLISGFSQSSASAALHGVGSRPACQAPFRFAGDSDPKLLGLMLGHVSQREARLWVRTDKPCNLTWEAWPVDDSAAVRRSQLALADEDFVLGTLTLTLLKPHTSYRSRLLCQGRELDNSRVLFTTPGSPSLGDTLPDLVLAMGSCSYINEDGYNRPGRPYGGDYQIFESIARYRPDAMFWLGDNTYLREPDFTSRSGIYHRYAHTRATPEMQNLLRSTPNYAIWDDHDYGPNDSDRSYAYKAWALEAFRDFWANPQESIPGLEGVMTRVNRGDVDLFLLDNRWHRSPNGIQTAEPTILGKAQEDWLIENLVSSKATFKLVLMGGQLLNTAQVWETYANIAPAERERLLDRIDREGISGVVVVSGDRHHSAVSRLQLPAGQWIYEFTASPLTASAHRPREENNALLVEGSQINQRNFALLEFSGPKGSRRLLARFLGSDGQELYRYEVLQPGFGAGK
jgi:alkaline phosphatase D